MDNIHHMSFLEGKVMAETIKYLEALVRETHKPEAEIMPRAFQTGLRQLWREGILGRYLRGLGDILYCACGREFS